MCLKRHHWFLAPVSLAGLIVFAFGAQANAADQTYAFDIPAEPLGQALLDFSKITQLQVAVSEGSAARRFRTGLHGQYTMASALHALLAGMDLSVDVNPAGVVVIRQRDFERLGNCTMWNSNRSSALLAGVSAATLALCANLAQAQDLETVVVNGTTLRNQDAIAGRRNALGVVDTLSQDDTGNLGDQTLAEALLRLPSSTGTQSPFYGEQQAEYVSVRGISPDLNSVTFDGITMFSAASNGNGSRRVDLDLIPTQIAQTTQVYKTFTPDMDAGAIGAAINIVPYSALDGHDMFYIDALGTYQDGYHVPGGNSPHYDDTPFGGGLSGLWVHKFGSANQFGVVLSGIYKQTSYDYDKRDSQARDFWTSTGVKANASLSNWNGLDPMPDYFRPMDYTHETRTMGGSARFEYRPVDDLELSLLVFDYRQIEDKSIDEFFLETPSQAVYSSPTVATFKLGAVFPDYQYDRYDTESGGVIFKASDDLGDNNKIEIRGALGLNKFYQRDTTLTYTYSPPNEYITYDTSGSIDTVRLSDNAQILNFNDYSIRSDGNTWYNAHFRSSEGKIDFTHNYDSTSTGFGYTAGIDWRYVDAKRDETNITYTPNGSKLNSSLAYIPQNFQSYDYYQYFWVNFAAFQKDVQPTLPINQAASANASLSADYTYKETVLAGYAAAMYATDDLHVIAGLRLDDTDYHAFVPYASAGTYTGAFTSIPGHYFQPLPSVSATYELSGQWRLKGAYSRTLGRPNFSDIAQAQSVNQEALTISQGNPNLRPRRSDNFDLASEYYFNGNNGMVSLGGFMKSIKDDIYTLTTTEQINNQTYQVTTPLNASYSQLKGIEFQLIDNSIPGLGPLEDNLGVSTNVTRMWAAFNYPIGGSQFLHLHNLQYQPDWTLNAAIFYRLPYSGEFRLAYNWKSASPDTFAAQPWNTSWVFPLGTLDAAVRFSLIDNLVVKFTVTNLLNTAMNYGFEKSAANGISVPYQQSDYLLLRNRVFGFELTYKE